MFMRRHKFYFFALIIVFLVLLPACEIKAGNNSLAGESTSTGTTNLDLTNSLPSTTSIYTQHLPSEVATIEGIITYGNAMTYYEHDISLDNYTILSTHYELNVGDESRPVIQLNFEYPQITGLADKFVEASINLMIFDAAFKVLGDTMTLTNIEEAFEVAQNNLSQRPSATDIVAEMDYQILSATKDYISFLFSGSNTYASVRMNTTRYLGTIDLSNAAYVQLTTFVDLEKIEVAIDQGHFEVYYGDYMPGGWDAAQMGTEFFHALIADLDTESLAAAHHIFSDRWDKSAGLQQIKVNDKAVEYREYDIYDAQNFAVDEKNVYISFSFYDSLDGTIILKLPKDLLM